RIVPRRERPDQRFIFLLHDQPWKAGLNGAGAGSVIEERLPEGTYQLEVELRDDDSGGRLVEAIRDLFVPSGESPLELPPMEMRLTGRRAMVGKPAPEIEATDLDTGRPVTLADFRGKVVILDFWGYWCGPCIGNMPHLVGLQRKFAGRPLEI